MLSKEEIEKAKEYFKYEIELAHKEIENHKNDEFKGYGTPEDIAKLRYCNLKLRFEYIEQLESDNYELNNRINDYIEERRELIEKLEEELERNKRDTKLAETGKLNLSSEEWREIATEDKLIKEILSILKGEKE